MKFIFDQFKPYMFSFWSEVRVWQKETCQYRPSVLLLGLISEIKSSYLTWQNSPKLWKHVGVFLFFFVSFLRVSFLKHPFKKVPSSPIDSDRGSHSITYLISLSVSPKVPWSVNANLALSTASEIWSYCSLLWALLYYLTTPRLIKDGRTANGKVFQLKYDNLKGKFALDFISYLVFLDHVSWVRGSSGNVNLAVSVQSEWNYLRMCFGDWPFWAVFNCLLNCAFN